MVKTGSTVLKIRIHSAYGPNFPGILDIKDLGQAYSTHPDQNLKYQDPKFQPCESITCPEP